MAVRIRAGLLRHNVKMQRLTVSDNRDAHGGPVETWETDHLRWVRIEPLSGREAEIAKQIDGRVTHKITMRHLPRLTDQWRIVHGTRTFNLTPPLNTGERDIETVVMAFEDTSGEA